MRLASIERRFNAPTARRYDPAADRTRAINRLRAQLLEYFPALERAFGYNMSRLALVRLTGYQTPAVLRGMGTSRLSAWLRNRKARNAAIVAAAMPRGGASYRAKPTSAAA